MRHERAGGPGGGRRDTFRRLVLAWVLAALLAGPLGSTTPAVAATRAVASAVQIAKVPAGAGAPGGRLAQRGGQAGTVKGRVTLVAAVEGVWSAQGGPQPAATGGVPVAGPRLGGLVRAEASPPTSPPVIAAPTLVAVRERAPPGGGTSAIAGRPSPLPA